MVDKGAGKGERRATIGGNHFQLRNKKKHWRIRERGEEILSLGH